MEKQDILTRAGRRTGMTVPEGYFDDFNRRMADSLPEQPWEQPAEQQRPEPRPTLWVRVRPYAYMAAMFMGIWLMMKMFDLMSPGNTSLAIDNNPVLTAALSDDAFVNEYFYDNYDYDLLYDDVDAPL